MILRSNSRAARSIGALFLFSLLLNRASASAQQVRPQPLSGLFATPLTASAVDNASLAEWVDGAERPFANGAALRQLLWTQTPPSSGGPLLYGAGSQPGVRHLRIGFTAPEQIGSVLVRGGDQLSVLRAGASYPGNMADDAQWIPAQRLVKGQPSADAVDINGYALWILPAGTTTRALRFTHTAAATDATYTGSLGGVYLLSPRLANLAPLASVSVSANTKAASLLVDEQYNGWLAWDNGPAFGHAVTPATPETILLTWPKPVALSGLAALWAGFNGADVQVLAGTDNGDPQSAPESAWHAISPANAPAGTQSWSLRNQYPRYLGVDWFDFGKTVTTRAVRIKITQVTDESRHPHLVGKTKSGNRVWLGELMALSPIGPGALQAVALPMSTDAAPKPPIPVHFKLDVPGYVSLVIEDAKGNRVRNLISDTWFEAGANTVWWDGTDDLGRNRDAAAHGVYLIPTHFVAPGSYRVRGLVHGAVDLHYEFSVYNSGNPPWETLDGKGGWLTNHTPPSSALFVPAEKAPGGKPLVYLGSYVSEGGAGLAWVDLDGYKQGGRGWIGGNWTAAPFLARDAGSHADASTYAYVGAAWSEDAKKQSKPIGVIRLTALTASGDKTALNYDFDPGDKLDHDANGKPIWTNQMGGLAVQNNLTVVSLMRLGQLLFSDASTGKLIGLAPVDNPRGIAFDSQGRLLVLSGQKLLRYAVQPQSALLANPSPLVTQGLEDPVGIAIDGQGNLYVSDRGASNQIKVFSPEGRFLHAIGRAGPLAAGPYDAMHMNSPRGIAIDSNQHLWVTEEDFQPKRVSLWTLDGKLLKAFYGPGEYGGGGSIDPRDKTKFYYHAMEFKLDWTSGTNSLASVLYRADKDPLQLPYTSTPGTAFYTNGHRYFTNTYLGYSTNGVGVAVVYLDRGGVIRPVAAFGKANDWSLLRADPIRGLWPQGTDPVSRDPDKTALFTWSDTNGNGQLDADEVSFVKGLPIAVTMSTDTAHPSLDMYVSDFEGKALRFPPVKVSADGVPIYDLNHSEVIADGAQRPSSDGGGQLLVEPQETVSTTALLPFAQDGVGGVDASNHRWSYPSLWPGLHASHSAPVPNQPGELIGTTRLLGGFVHPRGGESESIWGINGNSGDIYLFTGDGLYLTQLFQDTRKGAPWSMPQAIRGMVLNNVSLHDENFFPTLNQTPDGNIYVVDGSRTSIVRVDGLDSVKRIPAAPLEITQQNLDAAQAFINQRELQRQLSTGPQTLKVSIIKSTPPALKDLAASLSAANWATIDSRITKVGWADKPDVVDAAIMVGGGRLYAAYRTSDPNLLQNAGTIANAPFKTGGALDMMIGASASADPKRAKPIAGDVRLLVYLVNGKPRATLYRAVVPGTATPVPFSSPVRTITIDKVEDVSDVVELSAVDGIYAFSIPLETLGLKPEAGQMIRADIGILRGSGVQTLQRVYWSNKATGITADVPSEAELTPNLWGDWIFQSQR
jgi:hypothetical protein